MADNGSPTRRAGSRDTAKSQSRTARKKDSKRRVSGDDMPEPLIADAFIRDDAPREPDTTLHAMPGPPMPTPAWVIKAWEKALVRGGKTPLPQK